MHASMHFCISATRRSHDRLVTSNVYESMHQACMHHGMHAPMHFCIYSVFTLSLPCSMHTHTHVCVCVCVCVWLCMYLVHLSPSLSLPLSFSLSLSLPRSLPYVYIYLYIYAYMYIFEDEHLYSLSFVWRAGRHTIQPTSALYSVYAYA